MSKRASRGNGAPGAQISTGIRGLDDVLGGGLRAHRLYLVLTVQHWGRLLHGEMFAATRTIA